jgi:nucleoside-diphosphate-sugar epimerase
MPSLPSPTVLVTGANGYIGLHIVQQLLRDGKTVCATVRSERAAKTIRTNFQEQINSNQLRIGFVEDLTKPECFQNVFNDNITSVVHVASPGPIGTNIQDNVQEMLNPAITGATAVLEAAKTYGPASLRRIVQISSFAAMLDLSKGLRPGYVYTEADWNPVTYQEAVAEKDTLALYLASKTLSEKAVWNWVGENNPAFDIVCLCPSSVFGPQIDAIDSMANLHTTASELWTLVDASALPSLQFAGAIDVRDVALIAAAAVDKPEASGRRFLLAQHFDWQSAADVAREGLQEEFSSRIPIGTPGSGKEEALKYTYTADGSKVVKVLGVNYRPMAETVVDTLKQFLEVEEREKSCVLL